MKKTEQKVRVHQAMINDVSYLSRCFENYSKRGTEYLFEFKATHETYMEWIKICARNTRMPESMVVLDLALEGFKMVKAGKKLNEIIETLQLCYCTDENAIQEAVTIVSDFCFGKRTEENKKARILA